MTNIATRPTKAAALAQVQALAAGTQKHFPNGSFTFGNATHTTADVIQALQKLENAIAAVNAAQSSAKDAVLAMRSVEATVGPLIRDYKRFVLFTFGSTAQNSR
jgi:hypothetical protein